MGTPDIYNIKTVLVNSDTDLNGSEDSTSRFEIEVQKPTASSRTRLEIILIILVVFLFILAAILLHYALNPTKDGEAQKGGSSNVFCVEPGCVDAGSFIYHAMDLTANPCDDFFQYSCGGWIKNHPVPDGKTFYGVESVLEKDNHELMRQALEAPYNSTQSLSERKAMTYYKACMDTDSKEKRGGSPLKTLIEKIGGWNISSGGSWDIKNWDLNEVLKKMHSRYDATPFFTAWISEDDKNSSVNIIQISQSGLGLIKSSYSKNDSDKVIVAYLNYMTQVGVLLGGEENITRIQMREVYEFERELSKIFPPSNESITDSYNKINIKELKKLCPQIDWLSFIQHIFTNVTSIKEDEPVLLFATEYIRNLSTLISKTPHNVLNNYIIWKVVQKLAPFLSKPFRDAKKELTKAIYGTVSKTEQWRYCVSDTDDVIGMALGAMFVRKAFDGDGRQQAEEMISDIRQAFKSSLPDLKWMDKKTRFAAIEKAKAVVEKIGFPSWILNVTKLDDKYKPLKFDETDFFGNILNSFLFMFNDNIQQLRKPVDKNIWLMTPPTINAYYSPTKNQIVFPAGILQAPYYDRSYPKAVNFGGIGAVMGHELLHGFDNNGRLFDKFGNFGNQWWTNQSIKAFKERTKCIINQYSQFTVFGEKVDGKKTLGENIADNGGLKAAYLAYRQWVKSHKDEGILPAVKKSNDQVFFISFAQSWCSITTKAKALHWLEIDVHSPAKYRVLGSVSNSKYFAEAFQCPPNSPMNPTVKCELW